MLASQYNHAKLYLRVKFFSKCCCELLYRAVEFKIQFQNCQRITHTRDIRIHPIYECIILKDNNASNQSASKRKMLDKNEVTLTNTNKTKTDFYKLCRVIKSFNSEKSYAEFSVSSKKKLVQTLPHNVMRKDIFSFHYRIYISPHNKFMWNPMHPCIFVYFCLIF